MKIKGIIWLDAIVEKINTKHGVSQQEVRQIIQGWSVFRFVEKGYRRNENVYAALGQTKAGRYMIVFFVYKLDQRILVLSARDMTIAERKRYEKK